MTQSPSNPDPVRAAVTKVMEDCTDHRSAVYRDPRYKMLIELFTKLLADREAAAVKTARLGALREARLIAESVNGTSYVVRELSLLIDQEAGDG